MVRKPLAAVLVFSAALVLSLGCPRQESPPAAADRAAKGDAPSDAAAQAKGAAGGEAQHAKPPAADPPPSSLSAKGGQASSPDAQRPPDALFADWPRPKAVIVATGMQMGYIEPCGCSGKENQKGGLSRRYNMLKKLADRGWPILPVDVGGQVNRFGRQAEMKFAATADALAAMHYGAAALGADDLRLSAPALLAAAVGNDNKPGSFVMANVSLFGTHDNVPQFRIDNVGGLKIGVTGIIGAEFQRAIHNSDLELQPAEKALAEVMPDLQAAHCDRLLLLANATRDESAALAKQFPQFDFIVTAGGAPEPPPEPKKIDGGKSWLIEVGQKGSYANAIGLFDDAATPVRFQRIALDAHWGESDEMMKNMASYQEQLQQLGLEGLGLKPLLHSSGREFVGSKKCGECHTKAYAIWEKTPHATALDTLHKLKPERDFDPECLACHVTGWDTKRMEPFGGGYMSAATTPLLAGNGCENCHGPGSEHVAAESGDKAADAKRLAELRAAMRIPQADVESRCVQCHDGDNSLNFNFKTYWPKVEHKGKD